MAKRDKQKTKFDNEEGEEKQDLIVLSSSDDEEEANEDLSLKIVEKALSKRVAKLSQKDSSVFDDSKEISMVDLCSSDSLETEVAVSGSDRGNDEAVVDVKRRKKIRKKNEKIVIEIGDEAGIVMKEEEKAETVEKVEADEKAEAVKATQTVESMDQNAVDISDNIVLRKLLRGPRYFDPPDRGWETCYNCGEEGHMAVNCPSFTKRKKPCFVCGSLDHGAKQCKKGKDCFICKSGGHKAKDCPEKHKSGSKNVNICLRCGGSGHDMFSCRNDYSHDDLKETQCYVCKCFGHLCCVSSVDTSPRVPSCYKCGQLGHTGLACARLHGEGETTVKGSPSSCYKCGEEGHFARNCLSSTKVGKRNRELSTPTFRAHKGNKDYSGLKSAPLEHGKFKKKKSQYEERGLTTPQKSKHRGGWITEDPDFSQRDHWRSPSTPSYESHKILTTSGGHFSKSYSSQKSYHHRYSASRFGNSGNNELGTNYNWW